MIEIICDQYGLYSASDSDNIITETFQFEDELLKIKSHAESGASLRLIVRNPVLFKWFDAAIKYGARKKLIDPVAMLAVRLDQVAVPKFLKSNPHWIIELDLLDIAKEHPGNGEPVEDWIRKVLLGGAWGRTAPASPEELADVFLYLLNHDEKDLHPLEKYLLEKQLHFWGHNNLDNIELFSWLEKRPFKRACFIVWEQLLSLFPEDKVSAWLQQDDIWSELSQFPGRQHIPRLSLDIQLPEKIAVFVRPFLAKQWATSPVEAMSFISGELELEKNFLLERLREQLQNEAALSSAIYEKIIELKGFPEVVALARQLIPAKEPADLPEDCSIGMVQEWMADEYLPFYNSCSLLGQLESTEPYVLKFEKWLEQHYTNMLFGEGMAYCQLSQVRNRVLTGEPVLIVVFDGLDYLCAHDEFLPAMQGYGFFPVADMQPFFAFLPTQTYIAKPSLVAGKMKSQIPDEIPTASFYKKLIQGYLGVEEDQIRSKTDKDGSLLELIQEPALAYLYLDNTLDRDFLHSNIRQHIRKKKYGEHLRHQASLIGQCLKDFKDMYGQSLQVVICSDHGYTVIPKTATIIKAQAAKKAKTRTLFAHEIENTDDFDHRNTWKLNADLFGLNDEMILPRGYSCFNKRPQGATHGGCSPQEMAVPWFLLSDKKPAPLEPLSFSIEGEIFRKRVLNNLKVKISNPNSYLVKIMQLDISGLEMESSLPLNIGKNGVCEVCSSFNASAVSDSIVEFSVTYRLQSLAGNMDKKLILKVPTTGAMSTEFDDDFEF